MSEQNTPHPTDLKLRRADRILEVTFDDGEVFELPCEYLRVFSPSAEVRGHSPGQEVLQVGMEEANVNHIEPVGNYAVALRFDDGHDTGIYSWSLLYDLGRNYALYWQDYLDRLAAAGHKRRELH